MKVILTQDVKSQGKKGQLVEVSDGYARNFLLPKKLAVIATAENLNTMKLQEKARKAQEAAEKAEAEATAKKLKDLTVKIAAKAGEGGRLFGDVTAKEVSEALSQQHGVNIAKTKLVLDEHIKDHLDGNEMVFHRLLEDALVVLVPVLDKGVGIPDLLAQATRHELFGLRIDDLVLERRATRIDYQNVHRYPLLPSPQNT